MPGFSGFSFFIVVVLFVAFDIVSSAGIIYALASSKTYPMVMLKLVVVGLISVDVFEVVKFAIVRWLSN